MLRTFLLLLSAASAAPSTFTSPPRDCAASPCVDYWHDSEGRSCDSLPSFAGPTWTGINGTVGDNCCQYCPPASPPPPASHPPLPLLAEASVAAASSGDSSVGTGVRPRRRNDGRPAPVLVDGDETVVDSYEIFRYLDRVYPDKPLLGDGVAEARARFFKFYAERSLAPGIMRTILMDVFNAVHPDDREYFRTTREKAFGRTLEEMHSPSQGLSMLDKALEPMRGRLEESPFLEGDEAGASDYLVVGAFMWARVTSAADLISNADPVYAWFQRMLDLHGGVGREATRIVDIEGAFAD